MPTNPVITESSAGGQEYESAWRIKGWEGLFPDGAALPAPFDEDTPEDKRKQFPEDAKRFPGLPTRSTLLISGSPGAGKTTFALALVRALLRQTIPDSLTKEPKSLDRPDEKKIVYYISTEVTRRRLQDMFSQLGWFVSPVPGEGEKTDERLFVMNSPTPDRDNFYVIGIEPEVDRPAPSADDLLNMIFSQIAKAREPSESRGEFSRAYVIVDSITALLKSCPTQSEERRQSHEMLHRLRKFFRNAPGEKGPEGPALTILLAEQEFTTATDARAATIEDYLADVVFRLSQQPLALGRVGRVLEVVKSQGVYMTLGSHSWEIMTDKRVGKHLRDKELRKEVARLAKFNDNEPECSWGTVVIFPRPRIRDRGEKSGDPAESLNKRPPKEEPPPIYSGIPGLDAMLNYDPTWWLHPVLPEDVRGLKPGSTTLLAGPMGCGKSRLCEQFLKIGDPARKKSGLLVLFDLGAKEHLPKDVEDNCVILDFAPSQFDFNSLNYQLEYALKTHTPERVVFDGLSEWLTTYSKADAAKMIETLLLTVKSVYDSKASREVSGGAGSKNAKKTKARTTAESPGALPPRPTVLMTYELDIAEDPLAPQALGVNADNIIVLRQINIHDELRKIIYILKSTSSHDPNVRALTYAEKGLAVSSDLDSFAGLLRNNPGKATVRLQLYHENDAAESFNRKLVKSLKRLYALEFASYSFSRADIAGILGTKPVSMEAEPHLQPADLHIVSIDEWLFATLPDKELLNARRKRGKHDTLLDLTQLWSGERRADMWRNFWYFEIDKAMPLEEKTRSDCSNERPIYGVPAYMDFGVFCANAAAFDAPENTVTWTDLVNQLPLRWADMNNKGWFIEMGKQDSKETVVGLAHRRIKEGIPWGFTFDLESREESVCMFYELAWAFGADEDFLCASDDRRTDNQEAAKWSLRLLQFLVLEKLLPPRPNTGSWRKSVFSRHFYAGLARACENDAISPGGTVRKKDSRKTAAQAAGQQNLLALPFFPIGLKGMKQAKNLKTDFKCRAERLARRLKKFQHEQNEKKLEPLYGVKKIIEADDRVEKWNAFRKDLAALQPEDLDPPEPKSVPKPESHSPSNPNQDSEVARPSMDLDDLQELARLHQLQIELMTGEGEASRRLTAYDGAPASRLAVSNAPVPIATGYCCSGSWFFGVHHATKSPSLAADVLSDMCSLAVARQRADAGAGIPARKDFMEFHGHEPVPFAKHLTWQKLFRFCAARSRRRERVLGPEMDNPVQVYSLIHQTIRHLLEQAHNSIQEYHSPENPKQLDVVDEVHKRTDRAVETLWKQVDQLRAKSQNRRAEELKNLEAGNPAGRGQSAPPDRTI